jgi:glyoxylase-like metal-dependent hydrolase (beta-lactamase superfamily II)
MRQLKKTLKRIILSAVVVAVMATVAFSLLLRLSRHNFDSIELVQDGVAQVRNQGAYIYAAKCEDNVLVFDGGVDESGDALDALLGKLGVTRDQVTDVFLTHGHFDHIAHAPLCKNARIHIGIADTAMAANELPQQPLAARWLSWLLPKTAVKATDPIVGRAEFNFG